MKKKVYLLLAIIGIALVSLCGCGSKSVKGADGKEYDSYQSACWNQDFVAAYDWIEKNNGTEEDKDYVFNAEMLYLTSLGTDEASNRIVYLLAEYQIPGVVPQKNIDTNTYTWQRGKKYLDYIEGSARFNTRCDNVLDMAIAQENEQLARKIIKLYKNDINAYINEKGDAAIVKSFTWDSRDKALAKIETAFGKDKTIEVEESEEVEEEAPAQPTPKKKVNSKRRKR